MIRVDLVPLSPAVKAGLAGGVINDPANGALLLEQFGPHPDVPGRVMMRVLSRRGNVMQRTSWIVSFVMGLVAVVVVAPASMATAQSPFTGPLVAYEDYGGGRIIVEDLGAETVRDYPFATYSDVVWSPDGQRLVGVDTGNRALVVEVANGTITEIARDFAPCCEQTDE